MKCGMSCSLFEVVDGKGKSTTGSLAALVSKLERDRMVSHIHVAGLGSCGKKTNTHTYICFSDYTVCCPCSGAGEVFVRQGVSLPVVLNSDGWVKRCLKSFFLRISSHNSQLCQFEPPTCCLWWEFTFKEVAVWFVERRGRIEKKLQALFIFQESRMVVKYSKSYSLSLHIFWWATVPTSVLTMKCSIREHLCFQNVKMLLMQMYLYDINTCSPSKHQDCLSQSHWRRSPSHLPFPQWSLSSLLCTTPSLSCVQTQARTCAPGWSARPQIT